MSESFTVKRQIVVKTIVTDKFKNGAQSELLDEIKLIDDQINHFQVQLNQVIQQFQQNSTTGFSIGPQEAEQIMNELNLKLQQLVALKQNLQFQIENIKTAKEGEIVVTGSLENYVELKPGDNIYEKMLNNEVIVKDSLIQEINVS